MSNTFKEETVKFREEVLKAQKKNKCTYREAQKLASETRKAKKAKEVAKAKKTKLSEAKKVSKDKVKDKDTLKKTKKKDSE